MANTYTQIYIHLIFAVKGRSNLIRNEWKNELFKYITGIIKNKRNKLLAINGMPDHVHLMINLKPETSLSDLVRDVKSNSSVFINNKKFLKTKFNWQEGFGAFSHSQSQLDNVIRYIKKQELHHKKKTFIEEYKDFLEKYNIDYKPDYLFKTD